MADSRAGSRVVWAALLIGLAAGLLLELATFLLARYGPSGESGGGAWSFRGNGALVVPFGLGPAVLAGGWVAIVVHYRGSSAWLRFGVTAGVIGALLALGGALSVTLDEATALIAAQVLTLAAFGWTLLAPILAGLAPIKHQPRQGQRLLHAAAMVLFAAALVAAFSVGSAVLPPGS